MRNAVEASVSRAKKLGATSNLYIVEGSLTAYAVGSKQSGHEAFIVATRSDNRPTRTDYLQDTGVPIDTLWPRPNVDRGWARDDSTGLWRAP